MNRKPNKKIDSLLPKKTERNPTPYYKLPVSSYEFPVWVSELSFWSYQSPVTSLQLRKERYFYARLLTGEWKLEAGSWELFLVKLGFTAFLVRDDTLLDLRGIWKAHMSSQFRSTQPTGLVKTTPNPVGAVCLQNGNETLPETLHTPSMSGLSVW